MGKHKIVKSTRLKSVKLNEKLKTFIIGLLLGCLLTLFITRSKLQSSLLLV